MKPDEIQELLSFIASSGLDEVNIETDNFKIAVKRNAAQPAVAYAPAPAMHAPAAPAASAAAPAAAPAPAAAAALAAPPAGSANTVMQKSPMIGTFYSSSSPDQPALVKVGDEIKKGQVVCIIEAMKLFNEIEADMDGKVVQVLVQNATPVEYDQALFVIEPK